MKIFYYFYEKIARFLFFDCKGECPHGKLNRYVAPFLLTTNLLDKITRKVIKSESMQIFRGIFQKFDIPALS